MPDPSHFKIRNWERFQHYKHRNPPWIRLYRDVIDDADWYHLSAPAAKLLVELWLLASESLEGCLRSDSTWIAWRLRRDESEVSNLMQELVSSGHIVDARGMLAVGGQDAPSETEKSRVETEESIGPPDPPKKTRTKFTPPSLEEVTAYRNGMGYGFDPQKFIDHHQARGWKLGKAQILMKDWKAAVRTWEGNRRKWQEDKSTQEVDPEAAQWDFEETKRQLEAGRRQ